jgi:AraC-like DNA-binding protein
MQAITRNSLSSMADPFQVTALLESMPELYFYAKDRDSRYVMGNPAEVQLLGLNSLAEMLGKTDRDFFEPTLAELYIAEDQLVLAGEKIINKKWMVPDAKGHIRWYLSTKIPLHGRDGKVIGLCGLLRDLQRSDLEIKPYSDLSEVLEFINLNHRKLPPVSELAAKLNLSISQFDRKFKAFAGVSPGTYILKVRINAACQQLRHSERSVSEITEHLGFYDLSHFNRHFVKQMGLSPLQYRKSTRAGSQGSP